MIHQIRLAIILAVFSIPLAYGQHSSYTYQREVSGITESWHDIPLSIDVLSKTKADLSDLRIYGIKNNGDSIEAPYILKMKAEKSINQHVAFDIINTSHTGDGYFYTLEVLEDVSINALDLSFDTQNFDWKIHLEGSQDQNEWFSILDSYRIVSIQNAMTSFSFTTLSMPTSKYRFYRLFVPDSNDPKFSSASIQQQELQVGSYMPVRIVKSSIRDVSETKQTIVDLTLATQAHLSHLSVKVADTFDYYRPIRIKALIDSIDTEKGWKYQYQIIGNGTLNSFRLNQFELGNVVAKQLQLVIDNQDNQPLNIESIEAKANSYSLTARFTEEATYYLVYGNLNASKPRYDLAQFEQAIPANLKTVSLGAESSLVKEKEEPNTLFENKAWLWGVLILIVLTLGWFSVQMMRESSKS